MAGPSTSPAPLLAAQPAASSAASSADVATRAAASSVTFLQQRLRFASCDVAASLPVVNTGSPRSTQRIQRVLDDAVAQWVATATEAGCPTEGAVNAKVTYEAHGVVQVAIHYPFLPMEKFSNAGSYAFVVGSGERVDAPKMFVAAQMDDLRSLLGVAYQRAYHHRPDCVAGGYGLDPSSAVFTPDGFAFDDWNNIPMGEKNCGGTVAVLAYGTVARYLQPDLASLYACP